MASATCWSAATPLGKPRDRRPATLQDEQRVTSCLELINPAAQDAASVVYRLREFYRPPQEGEAIELVDLNALVESAVELTRPKWRDQALARRATIEVATTCTRLRRWPAERPTRAS